MSTLQIHEGDYVHVYKFERGNVGGILPYTQCLDHKKSNYHWIVLFCTYILTLDH